MTHIGFRGLLPDVRLPAPTASLSLSFADTFVVDSAQDRR